MDQGIEKTQEKLEWSTEEDEEVPYDEDPWRTFNRYTFYTYLIGLGMVGFLIGCISMGG